jgi:hypothetical protein
VPPFVPVKFTVDTSGEIIVSGSVVTPVGRFGIDVPVTAAFTSEETAVYIYQWVGRKQVKSVYRIATGQALYVDINGRVGLRITDRVIELTAFKGTPMNVEIKSGGGSGYRVDTDYQFDGY